MIFTCQIRPWPHNGCHLWGLNLNTSTEPPALKPALLDITIDICRAGKELLPIPLSCCPLKCHYIPPSTLHYLLAAEGIITYFLKTEGVTQLFSRIKLGVNTVSYLIGNKMPVSLYYHSRIQIYSKAPTEPLSSARTYVSYYNDMLRTQMYNPRISAQTNVLC